MSKDQGTQLIRLPSHVTLAELLSTTRESVARNLRLLEQQGLLIRRDRWHCQLTEPLVIDTPPCTPPMLRIAQRPSVFDDHN